MFSYSMDGTGVNAVGRVHISTIEEMRLSSKTRSPKGTKAFKIVCSNRIWVLAVPRSEGTPELWLEAIQKCKQDVKLIDEKDYLHAKKEKASGKKLYKMLPYLIEIEEKAVQQSEEVDQKEVSAMRTASAALNFTHRKHADKSKGGLPPIARDPTIEAVFCQPCDPETMSADTLPVGAIQGWCSWCFGCPGGVGSGECTTRSANSVM